MVTGNFLNKSCEDPRNLVAQTEMLNAFSEDVSSSFSCEKRAEILCSQMNEVLPHPDQIQTFQKVLSNAFQDELTRLSQDVLKHQHDLDVLHQWTRQAYQVEDKEAFPSLSVVADDMREAFYKAIWVSEGRKDEYDYGGRRCSEDPFVIRQGSAAILYPLDGSILDQHAARFNRDLNVTQQALLLRQLEVFAASLEKLSGSMEVKACFAQLHPSLQMAICDYTQLQEKALKAAKDEVKEWYTLGQDKIHHDITILLTLPNEQLPVSIREASRDEESLKLAFVSLNEDEKDLLAGHVYHQHIQSRAEQITLDWIGLKTPDVMQGISILIDQYKNKLSQEINTFREEVLNRIPTDMRASRAMDAYHGVAHHDTFVTVDVSPLFGQSQSIEKYLRTIPSLAPHVLLSKEGETVDVILKEVVVTHKALMAIQEHMQALCDKYPSILEAIQNTEHPIHQLYNKICLFVALRPKISFDASWKRLFTTLTSMHNETLGPVDAVLICERALSGLHSSPLQAQITDSIALRALTQHAVHAVRSDALNVAPQSCWKPIYTVQSENAKAKFKPLDPFESNGVKNECASYALDQICGIGLTQTITLCRQKDIHHVLHLQKGLLKWAQDNRVQEAKMSMAKEKQLRNQIQEMDRSSSRYEEKCKELQKHLPEIMDAETTLHMY